jgi:hypothetical protein
MILDVLARHVATRGAHPFLRHEGRTVSYGEFDRLANRAGHARSRTGSSIGWRTAPVTRCARSVSHAAIV